ncbi:hypothetical protein DL95DRAFT_492337 [Leptodontidium sp. 2 PMI_412]|nr:hypothetical protein DL95DRAFT_492337 [Leptodontidium sp. 2 PMI_412]
MYGRAPRHTLQEDAIPFEWALGLSLVTLVSAVTRLLGCRKLVNPSLWHISICCLCLACSGAILGIVASKVYERYCSTYLGLILVASGLLGLYEVESFRPLSASIKKLGRVCIWASGLMALLIAVGFSLCFIKAVPSWVWQTLLYTCSGIYLVMPIGYRRVISQTDQRNTKRLLAALWIPCPFVLVFLAFFRPNRLVLPAWIFYTFSCPINSSEEVICQRSSSNKDSTQRGIFLGSPPTLEFVATQGSGQAKEQQLQGKKTVLRPCVPGPTRSKAHIGVLREELELVKDAKVKLEFRIDELRRDMREVEAQKDSLKADLERLGVGAVLDSGVESPSKKRPRQG